MDAHLHEIAYDPQSNVLFRWCRICDKHFARCTCPVFEDYIISRGKEIDPMALKDLNGRPPSLDLLHR